jgi:hypothetical protein
MNHRGRGRRSLPPADIHKNDVGIVGIQKDGELIVWRVRAESFLDSEQSRIVRQLFDGPGGSGILSNQ